jgi:hypothetical protein
MGKSQARGCSIVAAVVAAVVTGLVALGLPASARAATFTEVVPVSDVVKNPCNGDMVAITGTMKVTMIMAGNKGKAQTSWPDTNGVALLSGTRYQANETTRTTIFPIVGTTFVVDFAEEYELVSQDGTSNFLIHMAIESTFDLSTPDVTVTMTRGGAECSGPTPPPP